MHKNEFCEIVNEEGLGKYNIRITEPVTTSAYALGCHFVDGRWSVYETDERGAYIELDSKSSESDGLTRLLEELRNKKKIDKIWDKIREN